jgi:streptogramin lyase
VIARGPEGTIWLPYSERGLPMIDRISPSGLVTGEFQLPISNKANALPWYIVSGLAEGPNNEIWFTVEGPLGESFIGRISSAGKVVEFPLGGNGNPEGIAMGGDGSMWFANVGEGKIGEADAGGIVAEYPIPTGMQTNMPVISKPVGIAAVGGEGNMWFIDDGQDQEGRSLVGRVTPTGKITEFALPAVFGSPYQMAVGSEGNIWFTERSGQRIGRVTPEGEVQEFTVTGFPSGAIALGSDGNMWFAQMVGGAPALGRITPTGTITNYGPVIANEGQSDAIAPGSSGDMWFTTTTDNLMGVIARLSLYRMSIPFAPVNSALPVISGEAMEGQVLSVSEGSWLHSPNAIAYQWQECDAEGRGCVDLPGEMTTTDFLIAADVGRTLRVVVSASNAGGSVSVVSAASAIVQPSPAPPVALAPNASKLIAAAQPPVVGATMSWSFKWAQAYTVVHSLVVHALPEGGNIEVACSGLRCPFLHRRVTTAIDGERTCRGHRCAFERGTTPLAGVDLASLFRGRRLGVGTRISVTIDKAGWIGKSFIFKLRSGRPPGVEIACASPSPGAPVGC